MLDFRLAGPDDRELVENLWAYCFEPKEHPFFDGILPICINPRMFFSGFGKTILPAWLTLIRIKLMCAIQCCPCLM